ncbi:hypothetical protein E2562_017395 [Oryza meyeriana var. granulata]|uniref:Uncharacterized protein n=1 Tax=Oryza meyeriana var. granulata TaxID=110450 RepID=A0A6G1D566_9ORYZ|nr:hypothetical protein E2562_017395 [Oryza meyeriana var. granulata]
MRDHACDTDSHQDGVGSNADAEEEFDGEAAPAAAGDGGMAGGGDEVEEAGRDTALADNTTWVNQLINRKSFNLLATNFRNIDNITVVFFAEIFHYNFISIQILKLF